MDDDHSFFERERDKLSREITAVRCNVGLLIGIWLIGLGLRRTAVLDERPKSQTGRSARDDKRV
jgi:hypothetical protein